MTSTLAVTVTALPTSGTPPLTVLLSSFPTGGLPPYAFAWDFGDGSSQSVSQSAVHSYAAGAFAASCTVTDTLGRSVTSPPIALTVSPVVPPASFTVTTDQVCVATNPSSLAQIPAGPALEAIPSGPALEAIPGTYYDRCLGAFVGADGVTVTPFVSSISNLDGSLTIAPTSGDAVASLNLANPQTWLGLQTFGTNISILGAQFAGGAPTTGQTIQFNGSNWVAATLSAAGTTWPTITDPAGAFVDTSTPGIGGVGFVGGGAYNPAPGTGLFTIGTANAGLTGNYLVCQAYAGTVLSAINAAGAFVVVGPPITTYKSGAIVVGTGTLSLPPNITDTVVLLAANQTLTTKTLTAPTINGAAMSGT
ncbi:MAG: PKD domain-containing protein, partial [Acidimicrobiales bacterium]